MVSKKLSVMRLINTKASTAKENLQVREKAIDYVLRQEACKKGLIYMNGINRRDVKGTFGYFAKAAAKEEGRPLKHLVISFGGAKLPWENYLNVTKQIANFYGNTYQTIAVVHDNIPNRPHAHILIDTFNVATEKKLSEGPQEFRKLVEHINDVLEQNGIPKLLQGMRKQNVCKYTGNGSREESILPIPKQAYTVETCNETSDRGLAFYYDEDKPIEAPPMVAQSGLEFMRNWDIRDLQGAHRFFYPEFYKK